MTPSQERFYTACRVMGTLQATRAAVGDLTGRGVGERDLATIHRALNRIEARANRTLRRATGEA